MAVAVLRKRRRQFIVDGTPCSGAANLGARFLRSLLARVADEKYDISFPLAKRQGMWTAILRTRKEITSSFNPLPKARRQTASPSATG